MVSLTWEFTAPNAPKHHSAQGGDGVLFHRTLDPEELLAFGLLVEPGKDMGHMQVHSERLQCVAFAGSNNVMQQRTLKLKPLRVTDVRHGHGHSGAKQKPNYLEHVSGAA